MKLIVAIVRPESLSSVLTSLNGRQVCLLSVSEVVTAGRGRARIYRGQTTSSPREMLRVEVAANDTAVDETVTAIARAHGPAVPGAKVFVTCLEGYGDLNDQSEAVVTGTRVE